MTYVNVYFSKVISLISNTICIVFYTNWISDLNRQYKSMETDLQTKVNRLEVSVDLLETQLGKSRHKHIQILVLIIGSVCFNQTHALQ